MAASSGVDGCDGIGWRHGGVFPLPLAVAYQRPLDMDTAVWEIVPWELVLSLYAVAGVLTPRPRPPPRDHAHSTLTLKVEGM